MNRSTDSKRRMCYKAEEHMKHTVAESTTLGQPEYTNRQNTVASYIPLRGFQVQVLISSGDSGSKPERPYIDRFCWL